MRVLIREKWELLWATNKRKCEGEDETEREKEKPDNRCKKKNLHTSQNKSC